MLSIGASSVTLRLSLSLFFLLTLYPYTLYAAGAPTSPTRITRFRDESFETRMIVRNRTVTCNGNRVGSKYPFPMYTCQDIRVDGLRVIHGYATQLETLLPSSLCKRGCNCGMVKGQPNDIQALCQAMLSSIGVHRQVAAAYVLKPICPGNYDEDLVKFVNIKSSQTYWETVTKSDYINGHVTSLQCLTQVDS